MQSTRYKRVHYIREDLEMIADNDPLNASTLRVAQQKTNKRIAFLREKYGIPEGQVPPDDWLWLNDLTQRELERWSLRNRGKTTYARALAPKRRHDRLPRSLVELGYLEARFVAYRENKATPAPVATEVHQDEYGMFIVVNDFWGTYTDSAGKSHDATAEGYSVVIQQFRYCFEMVNAAIAVLDGVAPPQPAERWNPAQQQNATPAHPKQGVHRKDIPVEGTGVGTANDHATDGQRGYFDSTFSNASFEKQNTMPGGSLSIMNDSERERGHATPISTGIDFEALRTAPLTAETIIALSSAVLSVPDRATCKTETWDKEWQRPAELLLIKLQTLDPRLAWERIDLTMRYMVDDTSPSYWRTGRTVQTPTTLRHVANHIVDYYQAYQKSPWHPAETTRYDGPPLDYEAGYQAVVPPAPIEETPAEPSIIIEPPEIPVHPAWMSEAEARALCDAFWDAHGVMPTLTPINHRRTRWYASIEVAPDTWLHFKCPDDWECPTPETAYAIDQALAYAAQQSNVPDPGGDTVVDAAQEPPDHDAPSDDGYLSQAEIEAELRGLRPTMPSAPDAVTIILDAAAPITEELAPTLAASNKVGMSLFIADALLSQIVRAGYRAEQRTINGDRAYIAVEVSPGDWQDFESASAWQMWRKASRASPGSVASVLSAAGGQGQRMEARQS